MRAVYIMIYLGIVLSIGALVLPGKADELSAPAQIASLTDGQPISALARIKAGDINCRDCDLSGTDLSHQCVKNGDLSGAKFDNATALYMCMSFANFSDASFRNTDLTAANLSHSNLTHADLTGARLDLTLIKGTNLSTVRGLTQAQLDKACGDAETRVPAGLKAKFCS
jgi:uncharacterized protein YjbI with pentapeptide repeats